MLTDGPLSTRSLESDAGDHINGLGVKVTSTRPTVIVT